MNVPRECFQCGAAFVGPRQARYCSPLCKGRANRRQQQVRQMQAELAHTESLISLHKRTRNHRALRFANWKARQLRSDLAQLDKRNEKRNAKRIPECLPDGALTDQDDTLTGDA